MMLATIDSQRRVKRPGEVTEDGRDHDRVSDIDASESTRQDAR